MKSATEFFTTEEKQKIEAAVKTAEEKTSGEIVPMVVDESYEYPRAELIGGGTLALAVGLIISWAFGGESIWWFVPSFIIGFILFQRMIRNWPWFKRKLIHPDELTAEVEEKALVSFLEQGLHETRDKTGILILISVFERRVQVLADSGINAKVPEHTWEELVEIITNGLKTDKTCDAVCSAVKRCGELLQEHFPIKHDDSNELPNLIMENSNSTKA
ncbi:MAG: TPM domain-containing protein [Deltaproteobacteria bacterium]|jgi:putative membrane protein|nr:TPM domain-containing protein [Deltaproteobacteria bacterium]MCW8894016.1 TPM domain-containing protein [Deltaproteobacteria bacterium]MCW9050239.1 TPM domain-containing protein [Deltaproteobacteria bacterium]